jgi:hypothetical protein
MESDPSPVVVTTGVTAGTTRVHHRDFPEIRAEGSNPSEAAAHLVNQLTRALDSALTDWRRQTMQHAIDDVKAFASNGG